MQQLLQQFIPEHYTISWHLPEATKRRAKGHVTITGSQVVDGAIRLHSADLDIKKVSVNQQEIGDLYTDGDQLVIPRRGAGRVTIDIDFELTITDAMHGMYPCYYKVSGREQELFATQFESHHAREAFPCVDEPEAKATFDITLVTPDTTVLSNMPIASQTHDGDRITTTFATTPRMSTYLVAFAVGDLQRKTMTTTSGVEVNVYATKAHPATSLDWALDQAARTIEFFDDYFGVPYPLPKSDHVALPDFSSGAMENWGLVTYREIALLADSSTTISGKQYIAEVIAHELSHQWFGNLVTMKWWDNLWLNESFATVMGYVAPNALHPDWNMWFEFSTSEGVMALRRDAIDGVQSVQTEVAHPDEIASLFDGAIVYAKGGRLMHMMQTWIGEDAFRAGLKAYFTKHQYDNTTGDDLWEALSAASGKDVGHLMNTWILQPGYPVVRASLEGHQLTLSQEQFYISPHTTSDRLWPIPLDASDSHLPELLSEQSITVNYSSPAALLLNQHDTGHYITLYDTELRSRIIRDLLAGKLSDVQRAQFLHEQTLLARGGYQSSSVLLELLMAYAGETSEKVWDIITLAIADIKRFVEHDAAAEASLRQYVATLARPQFARLGWQPIAGESENDIKLRSIIIGCMLYGEEPEVVDHALALYRTVAIDALDPELRSLILGAAVRHGDSSNVVDDLLQLYRTTTSAELLSDITAAATSSRDRGVLGRLIKLLKDTKTIRQQDTLRWFVGLLRNRDSRDDTWRWMRDNWQWIERTFASDKSLDYYPRYTANILASREQLGEYQEFFTPLRENPGLTRAIDIGILDLTGRIELLERDGDSVRQALKSI